MAIDTKEVILDTAEKLIAERGIDAVSLRSITASAQVNLAAVHYHFGSKEALVQKVFERRITPLNRSRLAMLDDFEAQAGDGELPVDDVLRALIEPAIRLYQDDERSRMFMRMCGRIYAEPAEYLHAVFEDLFRELLVRFSAAFARSLPNVPDVDRAWGVHFSVGAMIYTMLDSERVRRFSGGLCDTSDTEVVIEHMVRFCAAGMRAEAAVVANSDAEPDVAVSMGAAQ